MAIDFIKKGAAVQQLQDHDKLKQELRRAEMGKAWRFFLKDKEERKILFVDGGVDPTSGGLDAVAVYEHMVKLNGKWQNFVCPKDTNPGSGESCPFCESGDRNSLMYFLTIIDLTPYKSSDGKKTYPWTRKLFAFKKNVYEALLDNAKTFGGLRGHVFKVKRVGEKSERVGDSFIHLTAITDHAKAKQQFTRSFEFKDKDGTKKTKVVCDYEPLNYSEELTYKTSDELRKMGIGAPAGTSFQYGANVSPGKPDASQAEGINVEDLVGTM